MVRLDAGSYCSNNYQKCSREPSRERQPHLDQICNGYKSVTTATDEGPGMPDKTRPVGLLSLIALLVANLSEIRTGAGSIVMAELTQMNLIQDKLRLV